MRIVIWRILKVQSATGVKLVKSFLFVVPVAALTCVPVGGTGPTVSDPCDDTAALANRVPVRVETNFGSFVIELNVEAAPLHAANFLTFVDDGFYDGLLFHRNACSPNETTGECEPFVLQGGGFLRVGGELAVRPVTRDPVMSEAGNGLSNSTLLGVALALSGGNVNSGTSQFFINLRDNGFLDALGFTVFGLVVEGGDVINAIAAMERTLNPILPGELSLPVEDVIMQSVRRVCP